MLLRIVFIITAITVFGCACAEIIHSPIQAAAERAVGKKPACVVALDPNSGRILAMVNEDMACRKTYPPGSILKLVTAYAGLGEHVVTPDTTVICRNRHRAGRESLICSFPGGHGKVNIEEAIGRSCNVYFYELGERLGPERLLKGFRTFGLGSEVGGYPADQLAGSVPPSLSGEAVIDRAAIGEARCLRVTPLQMTMVTMAIANGGVQYRPFVGESARPVVSRRIRAGQGIFQVLRNGMRMAVTEGTAKGAGVDGLSVCGKTGSPATDANPDYRHAWFVGFAPYEHPKIVVVVFSEWGHGGLEAAPMAGKVFREYFKNSK